MIGIRLSRFIINTIGQILVFTILFRVFFFDTFPYQNHQKLIYIGSVVLSCLAAILYYAVVEPAKKNMQNKEVKIIYFEEYTTNPFASFFLEFSYYIHRISACIFYIPFSVLMVYVYVKGGISFNVQVQTFTFFMFAWGFYACTCLRNIVSRFFLNNVVREKVDKESLPRRIEIIRFIAGFVWQLAIFLSFTSLFLYNTIYQGNELIINYTVLLLVCGVAILNLFYIYPTLRKEKTERIEGTIYLKMGYHIHTIISCFFYIYFLLLSISDYLTGDYSIWSFIMFIFVYGMYVCSCLRNTTNRFLKRYNIDEKL